MPENSILDSDSVPVSIKDYNGLKKKILERKKFPERSCAHSLIRKKLSKEVSIDYTETGRPVIANEDVDVSISHKPERVFVGMVPTPYRIGVDIENINSKISVRVFSKYLSDLKRYSWLDNLSLSKRAIIYWSIKESFFKCIDHDLMPMSANIHEISKEGKVKLMPSSKIKKIIKKKKLKILGIYFRIQGNFVYSVTVANSFL